MKEKKAGLIAWIKEHKKQLFLAGISVTAIIGVVIGLKNKDAIMNLWSSLEKSITKVPDKLPESISVVQVTSPTPEDKIPIWSYTAPQEAFNVNQHIRNLSAGKHHSAEKTVEAAALGISLQPNQTIVDSYTKCAA